MEDSKILTLLSYLEDGVTHNILSKQFYDEDFKKSSHAALINSHKTIPSNVGIFYRALETLNLLSPLKGKRFIDAGGGPGIKALIAKLLFDMDVLSIDLCPHALTVSRRILGSNYTLEQNIFKADYTKADVIWAYEPIARSRPAKKFILTVCTQLKPGATFLYLPAGALAVSEIKSFLPSMNIVENHARLLAIQRKS